MNDATLAEAIQYLASVLLETGADPGDCALHLPVTYGRDKLLKDFGTYMPLTLPPIGKGSSVCAVAGLPIKFDPDPTEEKWAMGICWTTRRSR